MPTQRLAEIDLAKGVAIILVVLGHLAASNQTGVSQWYLELKNLIYHFHMSFFMFLAGLIFAHTYRPVTSIRGYSDFLRKKGLRLIPAFFVFGAITLVGKAIAVKFLHVDNVPTDLLHGFIEMLMTPAKSAAGSLWFVYVLFEFYAVFPLLLAGTRQSAEISLLVCAVLYTMPGTPILMIDGAFGFAIFFSIGIFVYRRYDLFLTTIHQFRWLFVGVFLISFALVGTAPHTVAKLAIGICSVPALMVFVQIVPKSSSKFLLVLGQYSFVIYLLNTITIGLTKGILFRFATWEEIGFVYYVPILFAAGLLGPVWLKKYVLLRQPYLDKITR